VKIPPWSYSFLRDLGTCPHKAYRKYIARDLPKEEERSPALKRGIETHALLEHYLKDGPVKLPPAWASFADPLKAKGALAEVQLGMSQDRAPIGFWDDPWGRGKVDALVLGDGRRGEHAFIVENGEGARRPARALHTIHARSSELPDRWQRHRRVCMARSGAKANHRSDL
jgi:hypothetical protein